MQKKGYDNTYFFKLGIFNSKKIRYKTNLELRLIPDLKSLENQKAADKATYKNCKTCVVICKTRVTSCEL